MLVFIADIISAIEHEGYTDVTYDMADFHEHYFIGYDGGKKYEFVAIQYDGFVELAYRRYGAEDWYTIVDLKTVGISEHGLM